MEQDLAAELAFHREMAAAHDNPLPLGNSAVLLEEARELWRFTFIENLWRDIVYAARALWRSPGFTLSAILSLALGIGVNTTMFSLAVEFMLSEPSVRDGGSLAYLRLAGNSHAKRDVVDFVQRSGLFQDVAGENEESFVNWNDGTETRRLFAVQTTKNYFTALGIPVTLGRGWTPSDSDQVAVLPFSFWRKYYDADPSVIGRVIRLDGRPYTVLGVLPESHRTLVGYGFSPDIYLPRYVDDTYLAMYVRLKAGSNLGEARASLPALAQRLDEAVPESFKYGNNATIVPVSGFERIRHDNILVMGVFFVILLVLVGLVLLIACVNVAGLLLARASVRRQEIAIRLSLGASRGRLLQQVLSESLLLSVAGAVCGFGLALVVAKLLATIPLPLPIPIRLHIEPDWRVVGYAAVLTMASTLVTGLMPALRSLKESLTAQLHRENRLRLRRFLVAVQVAVSFVVLATGALFLRNLLLSSAVSPGFDVRNTLRAEVNLPPAAYHNSQAINHYVEQSLRELRAIPGMESAAAARIVPFTDSTRFGSDLTFQVTGQKQHAEFHWNAVTPDYFRVMSIPLAAGRVFSASDNGVSKVVIVNQEFANRYVSGRNPVGATFLWGGPETVCQIVGVVRGTKNLTIGEEMRPQLYEPLAQIDNNRPRLQFVLRSALPPALQLAAVRQVLRRVEPSAGLEIATLFSSIGMAFLPSQIGAALMGSIGLLGLLLAAIGLYGVLAYSVARRTREIGIRMAIGATRGEISRLVLVDSARLVGTGMGAGFLIAVLVTRPLTMFFVAGLRPSDPLSYVLVVVLLSSTGLLAALGPLRRAISVDPMNCLRYE